MTEPPDGDRAIVEGARAALQRSEVAHRQAAAIPDAPEQWAADHAVLAEHAALYEHRLAYFDPARRLDGSGFDALCEAEEALRREAANWRSLSSAATQSWRDRFMVSAAEAERSAHRVLALRGRLVDRDRADEMERLCRQPDLEADR